MNRHTKIAIAVAPFLAIGGFFAADYYARYKAEKEVIHQMALQQPCNIRLQTCELRAGNLLARASQSQGVIKLEFNHAMDNVQISLSQQDTGDKPQAMKPDESGESWTLDTRQKSFFAVHNTYIIRLAAMAGKHVFLGEFNSKIDE